ncbi:PhnD/SsuA/transferrin family substrate-binding protein [Candidatus Dojkabacteria bacterium]|nr:PhnD/SsuA/transferrin family substrate-binding protein [Candidatus Dojkabacteria bacterium]
MNITRRFPIGLVLVSILIVTALSPILSLAQEESDAKEEVKIGVLALNGDDEAYEDWNDTADYLNGICCEKYPGSNNNFSIVPVGFDEIDDFVGNEKVDFIIVNSNIYVYLEYKYDIGRIATLKKKVGDGEQVQFGGVIFTRGDHPHIFDIDDINKDTTIAAVADNSLGGFLVQKGELLNNHDIDIDKFSQEPIFLQSHKDVVRAVIEGEADIGFVRTSTIEEMVLDGNIESYDVEYLIDYSNDENFLVHEHSGPDEFPFAHSTDLYPEWPIAKLRSTPNELSERVATSLIEMDSDDAAAQSAGITGWTIPLNYQPVHDLQKSLKISPYENYGEVSLRDFYLQYRPWIVSVSVMTLVLSVLFIYTIVLYQRVVQSQKRITQLNDALKQLNDALKIINKLLRHDILNKLTGIKLNLESTGQLETNEFIS